MSRLFSLKTSQDQLSPANNGMADMKYQQYAPSRDVTGNNFPNGAQYIKWHTSGTKWWVPKRTYLRMRATLTTGANGILNVNDLAAPNMNLFANLYQSLEFRMSQQTICRVSDYVAQIDTLKKRTSKSKAWLESIGNSECFIQPLFQERQAEVISDGTRDPDDYLANRSSQQQLGNALLGRVFDFLDLAGPNQVQIFANGDLLFTQNVGAAIPDLSVRIKIGDYVAINDGAEKIRRVVGFATTNTLNDTIQVDVLVGALTAVGVGNYIAQVRYIGQSPTNSRTLTGFELIWQPPLGIFDVPHAMPAGDYELVLNPQNTNIYQELATETILVDKDAGANADDIKFNVVDMYLYVCEVEGPRVTDTSYLLDLTEVTCQKRALQAATGLQQEEFSVSPSTNALTLAFQDSRATSSATRYSPARFKIEPQQDNDLKLIRMFINYAGRNKPQTDADPAYKITASEDYTIQRYNDSIMYSGIYYSQGGAESIEDWHNRGPYYFFAWPKDGTDKSTRVFANYQFNEAIANGTVMLFNHYKKVALIKIENGKAVRAMVQEM